MSGLKLFGSLGIMVMDCISVQETLTEAWRGIYKEIFFFKPKLILFILTRMLIFLKCCAI